MLYRETFVSFSLSTTANVTAAVHSAIFGPPCKWALDRVGLTTPFCRFR